VVGIVGAVAASCLVWVLAVGIRAGRRWRATYDEIVADMATRAIQREITAAALMDSRDVDELLDQLRDGWTLHAFPNRREPHVLAYSRDHGGRDHGRYVDVVILRGADRAAAFRVPVPPRSTIDVLAPEVVVWCWIGSAETTLRQMFALPRPNHPDAPSLPQPAPPECRVHPAERDRMTYRPLLDH